MASPTVVQARRKRPSRPPATARSSRLVLTRAALSIDNLIVGFALGAYKVPIALAAIAIEVVSVGMSLLGLEVGDRLGTPVEMRSSEVGGIVLILVGAAIAAGISKQLALNDPHARAEVAVLRAARRYLRSCQRPQERPGGRCLLVSSGCGRPRSRSDFSHPSSVRAAPTRGAPCR